MTLTQYDPVENPLAPAMPAAKIVSGRKGTDMQHPIENSAGLYRLFNAIPDDVKEAHQPFSIRLWRGLSWLQCSELAEDVDTRYMLLWVAFNAAYGQDDTRQSGARP
jgi:hypothetical protein